MSDLISRKWLMECVEEGWIKFDTEKDTNIYIHLIRDIAPSADAVPVVHGEWKEVDDAIITGTCSVCGWNAIFAETDVTGMPYCPNCGAKMGV